MSRDPVRLSAHSETPPNARDVLRCAAAIDLEPPPGAEEAVLAALASKLGPLSPPDGGDTHPSPAADTASAGRAGRSSAVLGEGAILTAGKVAAAVAAVALAVATAMKRPAETRAQGPAAPREASAIEQAAPPVQHAEPSAASASSRAASTDVRAAPSTPPISPAPVRRTGHARPVTSTEMRSDASGSGERAADATTDTSPGDSGLGDEVELLADARRALRRGDTVTALARLTSAKARYPQGVLDEEREALTIEALAHAGHQEDAATRAVAFLRAHPGSAFTDRVRPFANRKLR